jgi:hypothetical protein
MKICSITAIYAIYIQRESNPYIFIRLHVIYAKKEIHISLAFTTLIYISIRGYVIFANQKNRMKLHRFYCKLFIRIRNVVRTLLRTTLVHWLMYYSNYASLHSLIHM